MIASHPLHDAGIKAARMLPRNVWLAAPFLVLAVVVTSFTVTPLWIQRRAAELREPAYAALASSVQALGALIEMREQQHRAIVLAGPGGDAAGAEDARQRLSSSLLTHASARAAALQDLGAALRRFLGGGSRSARLPGSIGAVESAAHG
jgi:hypothetical protein